MVYAYDRSEPEKQRKVLDILEALVKSEKGVLSSQILSKFFNVATRKLEAPLSVEDGYDRVSHYLRSWEVLDVTGLIVLEAVRGVKEYKFSFWDSLIWATARMNQVEIVLSEDFSDNTAVEGIRFINPFKSRWR